MQRITRSAVLVGFALAALPCAGQDAKEQQKPARTEPRAAAKADAKGGAKAPDQAAAMKAWQEASTPGTAHKKLDAVVGSWTAHVKMWMAPGTPPQESDGTMEAAWILGGRFVRETFRGTMMGQPYQGEGLNGYDNVAKKYVSTWVDDMSTAVMVSTGAYDAAGNVLTMTASMLDPLTKKPAKVKSVVTATDADHMHWEMWGPDPSGKPFKNLEIDYTRKK